MWMCPSAKVDENTIKEELYELEDCNNGNEIVTQLYEM